MARQKKIKTVQIKENIEEKMPEQENIESMQQEIDLARQELEKTKREIAEKKLELSQMKNREIAEDEQRIIDKQITRGNESEALKEKISAQKRWDDMPVKGKFMNRRAPGQSVKLLYQKYATDPVKWYPFEDGKVYTIPRGFADQINGGTENDPCYYTPRFIQKQGEMDPNKPSSAIHEVDSSNKKYAFVPVNF